MNFDGLDGNLRPGDHHAVQDDDHEDQIHDDLEPNIMKIDIAKFSSLTWLTPAKWRWGRNMTIIMKMTVSVRRKRSFWWAPSCCVKIGWRHETWTLIWTCVARTPTLSRVSFPNRVFLNNGRRWWWMSDRTRYSICLFEKLYIILIKISDDHCFLRK